MEPDVATWGIDELWKNYPDVATDRAELEAVKNGINMKISIRYLINEWYRISAKTKEVFVKGYGTYDLDDFFDEKEARERIMRNSIMDNLLNIETEEPRVKEDNQ